MKRSVVLLALLALLLAAVAAGCGEDDEAVGGDDTTTVEETVTTEETETVGQDGSDLRIALVTDTGGLNDKGFNALANQGLNEAKDAYGVTGRVLISKTAGDYVPNLSTAARQGYDLIIANGFLMADAVATVAKQFPDSNFAIIDFPAAALQGTPPNVRGLVFAEEEAGYLAGVAAATVSESGTVSTVGGQKIPPVDAFIAGFRKGAKDTKSDIKTLNAYSQEFVKQDPCKELALNQIGQNSDVVFQVAGGCGLGALQAAKDRNVWGIGVDNDQAFLGPHILTSAQKKVNVAVSETVKLVIDGGFEGGTDSLFNVENEGVGFGEVSPDAPDREALIEKLEETADAIVAGDVGEIPRTVG